MGLHVFIFLTIVFLPDFIHMLPERETKITWVRLSKGLGEEGKTPYKKVTQMPKSTLRDKELVLKESKEKDAKDDKTLPADKPLYQRKMEPKPREAAPFKAKEGTPDRTIEEALAKVQEELKQRQVDLEAAQVPDEQGGNSPDGSLEATDSNVSALLAAYAMQIKRKVNDQWITTPKQVEEGETRKTVINVLIDASGEIVSATFDTKSGDVSFDQSAMRAIERASPFPIPPEEIKQEAIREGFLIEFSPRSVVGA